jgi:hypothetical protein
MAIEPSEILRGIQRIYQRFAQWRNAHPGMRLPIPPRLRRAAAKVAREHGVCRTAQVLRLEYGKLKRMAESGGIPIALDLHQGRRMRRSAASVRAEAKGPATKIPRAQPTASLPSFLEVAGSTNLPPRPLMTGTTGWRKATVSESSSSVESYMRQHRRLL